LVLILFILRVISFTFRSILHTLQFGTPLSEAENPSILGTLASCVNNSWVIIRVGAFETTSGVGIWRLTSRLDTVLDLNMVSQIDITAHFIGELQLILELVHLHLQLFLLGESPI